MSDEKDIKNIHGVDINLNGHEHAARFLEKHVGKEQLEEMIHNARHSSDHNSHFIAHIGGKDIKYRLEQHDGKLSVHQSQNS
jgi:hypothetical protein